jgi:hypothetical protein
MNSATTRARSDAGNQYVRYRMMPGKNPASATPSRNRSSTSTDPFGTNAIAVASTPQVTMIRAIHRRAPNRCSARLLGTSSSRYPMKKTPDANPNAVAVSWSSSRIPFGPANPMFTRSR